MIDMNKQYRTRDGREVRIYAVDGGGNLPVHGAVRYCDAWVLAHWTEIGRSHPVVQNEDDLIEVKPRIKRTEWLNVYDDGEVAHKSERHARSAGAKEIRARVPIEIDCEYGEGLE